MVQTVQPNEYDLEAFELSKQWWEAVSQHCDSFFATSARFESDMPSRQIQGILLDLEMSMNSVVEEPFPLTMSHARRALLEAMASMLHGYHATLHGKDKMGSNYLGVARRHLTTFYSDLDELGLN